MKGLIQDVRFGFRLLVRAPGFTAVAVLVLALGIGVNTAVFTLVNAIALQPINGGRTGALIGVYNRHVTKPDSYRSFSYPDYVDLRDRSGVFTRLAAQDFTMVGVSEHPGTTRHTFAGVVSSSFFDMLGVSMLRGRPFTAAEETPGHPAQVTIVTYDYWRRMGFDAGIVGRTIAINSQPFTVVGVAPEGFTGTMALFSPEIWLPLSVHDQLGSPFNDGRTPRALSDRAAHSLMLSGRLVQGLPDEVAGRRLETFARQLAASYPAEDRDHTVVLHGLSRLGLSSNPHDDSEVTSVTSLLMGTAAIVLLVACLNLANMLLARGTARRREIAIRLAIGGGRLRIVRQLLTEGLILSAAGGLAGLVLAFWSTRAFMLTLVALMPLPISFDATPDVRVLGTTMAFALLSTVVAALGPAWKLTRPDVLPDLKDQPHGFSPRHGWRAIFAIRQLLVVGQLALSLALLTAGGLFLRGALAAASTDPGFSLERGLIVTIDPTAGGYDEARGRAAYRTTLDRLRTVPGVQAVSMASVVPFGAVSEGRGVEVPGKGRDPIYPNLVIVGSDYFAALGLPVLRGRGFTRDEETSTQTPRIVVINDALARELWPGVEPIGQQLRFSDREADGRPQAPLEVVGVVPGIRHGLFDRTPTPHIYLPLGLQYRAPMTLHVRLARGGADAEHAMLRTIQQELRAIDPGLPIVKALTLTEHRDASIELWLVRAGAGLFTTFGALAVLLAAVGLYGVKAYLVARRTREIGIRMALGAQAADVVRMIVGDGLRVTAAGIALGLVLSAGTAVAVGKMLYRVSPFDPVTFAIATVVLLGAGLVASWVPARRATRVAPVSALRTE